MILFLVFYLPETKIEITPFEIGYTPLVISWETPTFPSIFIGVPQMEPPMPFDPYTFPLLSSYKIFGVSTSFRSWRDIRISFGTSGLYSEMLVLYYFPIILCATREICKGKGLYLTAIFPLYKVKGSLGLPYGMPIKTGIGIYFYSKINYLMFEIGRKIIPNVYWGKTGYVNGFYLEIISGIKWRKR